MDWEKVGDAESVGVEDVISVCVLASYVEKFVLPDPSVDTSVDSRGVIVVVVGVVVVCPFL